MANLLRTTVTLPDDLLRRAKIISIKENKTLSQLIRESLEKRIREEGFSPPTKEELLSLIGTIEPRTPMFKNPRQYIEKLRKESDELRNFSG